MLGYKKRQLPCKSIQPIVIMLQHHSLKSASHHQHMLLKEMDFFFFLLCFLTTLPSCYHVHHSHALCIVLRLICGPRRWYYIWYLLIHIRQ